MSVDVDSTIATQTREECVSEEIEALQAILLNDVTVKYVDDKPHIVETIIHPSTGDDQDQQYVCVTIEVTITPEYPDKSPEVRLRNPRGLDDTTINRISKQIDDKLVECVGAPVMFELIELVRENLTESNLPSGQCAICLYGFQLGDVFIKTQCYHHFHSNCLSCHLEAGEKNHKEEYEKLPTWQQQQQSPDYKPVCPVCRSEVQCDRHALAQAPPPLDAVNAPPFRLSADLIALQCKMAALLAKQVAKGGTVTDGDLGPPPLTITTVTDTENEDSSNTSTQENGTTAPQTGYGSNKQVGGNQGSASSEQTGSPRAQAGRGSGYRGPYRGFHRRGRRPHCPRGAQSCASSR